MQQTATWNFAPADKRLADLMKSFGCVDVVAPVDAAEFGRRACELICRKKAESVTPAAAAAGKYRLRALLCFETAAQSRDPYANDVLTKLAREFMQDAHKTEHGESFEKGKPPLAHLY
jgi:hypothetical protein